MVRFTARHFCMQAISGPYETVRLCYRHWVGSARCPGADGKSVASSAASWAISLADRGPRRPSGASRPFQRSSYEPLSDQSHRQSEWRRWDQSACHFFLRRTHPLPLKYIPHHIHHQCGKSRRASGAGCEHAHATSGTARSSCRDEALGLRMYWDRLASLGAVLDGHGQGTRPKVTFNGTSNGLRRAE